MQESCMQKDHCIQTYLPVIALTLRDIKLKKIIFKILSVLIQTNHSCLQCRKSSQNMLLTLEQKSLRNNNSPTSSRNLYTTDSLNIPFCKILAFQKYCIEDLNSILFDNCHDQCMCKLKNMIFYTLISTRHTRPYILITCSKDECTMYVHKRSNECVLLT